MVDQIEAELLLQRSIDPVVNYKPWPTQARCFSSRVRYRWIGGANRKGKSAHVAIEAASAARRIHPTRSVTKPTTGLILAPSREQLQDPWEKKLLHDCELPGFIGRPLIPEWEIAKKYYTHGAGAPTIREIRLKNGNIIRFGVSKDPETWKRRAGQQLAWIILDESEGNENLLNELYPRLLDANKDEQIVREAGGGWILWGATPTTANAALMKFIQACDDPKLPDWAGFRLGDVDGDENDKVERERLRGAFTQEDFELRMQGKTAFVDRLLIYGRQWDDNRHMARTDYQIQPTDNLWVAYDPGGAGKESHDTGILVAAINQDAPKLIRIVHYLKLNRTTLAYDMKALAHVLKGRQLEGLIPDPAINKTEKGTGVQLRVQLRIALMNEGITAHRGLIHVLNWHDPGIKLVQGYLEQDLIQINPSYDSGGQLVRQQLVSYRSYEPGVYQGVRGVVKVADEAPDCLRYLCMARPRWTNRPCGTVKWTGPEKPPPPPPPPPVVLTPEQENYQLQLARSARLAAPSLRPRFQT